MKAEERKALETNVLAQQLGRAVEGIKQGPSRETTIFLIVVAVIALVAGLFYYFYTSAINTASNRWLRLSSIVFTEQLDQFVEESDLKDTIQGRLGRFKEARVKLNSGLRDLAANYDSASKDIQSAIEMYTSLIPSVTRLPLLHQEALAGCARGHEALGNMDEAIQFYERLVREHPTSALGKDASTQLTRLNELAGRKAAEELARSFAPASK